MSFYTIILPVWQILGYFLNRVILGVFCYMLLFNTTECHVFPLKVQRVNTTASPCFQFFFNLMRFLTSQFTYSLEGVEEMNVKVRETSERRQSSGVKVTKNSLSSSQACSRSTHILYSMQEQERRPRMQQEACL